MPFDVAKLATLTDAELDKIIDNLHPDTALAPLGTGVKLTDQHKTPIRTAMRTAIRTAIKTAS